jgi:hypothetical protein
MKKSSKSPRPAPGKNLMVLQLLILVPEFRDDVTALRKEIGINEDGFQFPKELYEWAEKKDIWYYEGEEGLEEDNPSATLESIQDNYPSNFFEEKMLEFGIKYKLPFNFYASPHRGLAPYVLSGRVSEPDSNFAINFKFHDDTLLWTSLIAYAPLSKIEARKAVDSLRDTQMNTVPLFLKGSDTFGRKQKRTNMERDLSLFEKQVARSGKPKKIKMYEPGSYLEIASKSKTSQNMKRVERIHKSSVFVDYDNPTSKQIGKKLGVSAAATRQAKKRLNLLAQELFGYDLEP